MFYFFGFLLFYLRFAFLKMLDKTYAFVRFFQAIFRIPLISPPIFAPRKNPGCFSAPRDFITIAASIYNLPEKLQELAKFAT